MITFTGRRAALVTRVGPSRGAVSIYVNGVFSDVRGHQCDHDRLPACRVGEDLDDLGDADDHREAALRPEPDAWRRRRVRHRELALRGR